MLSRLIIEVNYCSTDSEGFVNPAVKFIIDVTRSLDEPLLQVLIAGTPAHIKDTKSNWMPDELEAKYYEEQSSKVSLLACCCDHCYCCCCVVVLSLL